MNIEEMQRKAWENSEDHGFHEDDKGVPTSYVVATKLMLAVSELAEALEEQRDKMPFLYYDKLTGKPEGVAAELADVVIRCGDLAGILDFNLQHAIEEKMAYNATRPYKHGRAAL